MMEARRECINCFVRQAAAATRLVTPDRKAAERVLNEILYIAESPDLTRPPAAVGQAIHRRVRELTGNNDPYRRLKRQSTQVALAALPELALAVRQAPDPLFAAAQIATAANVIDFAAVRNLTPSDVIAALRRALDDPFLADWEPFRESLDSASHILYLTDNAGEVVFDGLFIEYIGPERVTVAVHGNVVINDATLEDARCAGLHKLVEIITNGSDAPGTLLEDCSEAFLGVLARADLIIAKGQGNYETLHDLDRPLFFLFKVKCNVVSATCGFPVGTLALVSSSPSARTVSDS